MSLLRLSARRCRARSHRSSADETGHRVAADRLPAGLVWRPGSPHVRHVPTGPAKDSLQWRNHRFHGMAQIALVRHNLIKSPKDWQSPPKLQDDTPAYNEVVVRPLLNQLLLL
jgi:hypothetical protein